MVTDADRRIREEAARQARIRQQQAVDGERRERIKRARYDEDARRMHQAVVTGLRARNYPDPISITLRPEDPASQVIGVGMFACWHLGLTRSDWKDTTTDTNYYLLSDGNVVKFITAMAHEYRIANVSHSTVVGGLRALARKHDLPLPPPTTEAEAIEILSRQKKPSRWRRIFGD